MKEEYIKIFLPTCHHYKAEISPIWCKTAINQSINQSINPINVCLFVWLSGAIRPRWEFHSHGSRRHHYRWKAANFNLQSALMPLSNNGSLWCHIYCDMDHPFMVVSEDPSNSHFCWAFGSGAVTTCFKDLGVSQPEFEHLIFHMRGERSNRQHHRCGLSAKWL